MKVQNPFYHLNLRAYICDNKYSVRDGLFIQNNHCLCSLVSFPGGSDGKASACNVGDLDSISGSGRSPGEGNGNPFQCAYLENPMDRGALQATVHEVSRVRHNLVTKPTPPHVFFKS